jgi:hypothetical protein
MFLREFLKEKSSEPVGMLIHRSFNTMSVVVVMLVRDRQNDR